MHSSNYNLTYITYVGRHIHAHAGTVWGWEGCFYAITLLTITLNLYTRLNNIQTLMQLSGWGLTYISYNLICLIYKLHDIQTLYSYSNERPLTLLH